MVRNNCAFKIGCAGLIIEIICSYDKTREYCKKYIVDDTMTADITINPTDDDINLIKGFLGSYNDDYIELVAISHMLSDAVIGFNSAVVHGSAISYNGEGVIFTAKSGVGKTTHTMLWKKVFGNKVSFVNGDKPIISIKNGKPYVSGSPFCGKEGYSENVTVPLKKICFIERGEDNSIEKLSPSIALNRFFKQIFIPRVGSELMAKAMEIIDAVVKNTEFYILKCNMTDEAPKTARKGIFGED